MSEHTSTVRGSNDSSVANVRHAEIARAAEAITGRWLEVGSPDLPRALEEHPEISQDRSVFLDLVLHEYRGRARLSKGISPDDYCRRFPGLDSDLLQSIHRLIEVEQWAARDDGLAALLRDDWPKAGDRFCGFELIEEIGRGAMARVYLCTQRELGSRSVVLKVTRQLRDEASVLGKLEHPAVVPVYSVGRDDQTGLAWICMPYLGRHTLQSLLSRDQGRLAGTAEGVSGESEIWPEIKGCATREEKVAAIFSQVADGIAYLHSNGLLHGDIKPSNVLITDGGDAVLIDFNLATELSGGAGVIGGTLPYMSPEQLSAIARGGGDALCAVTAGTEAFSFGVMLHQALTGALPYGVGGSDAGVKQLAASLLEAQASLETLGVEGKSTNVDRPLRRVIASCLERSAEARLSDFVLIREELLRYLGPAQRVKRLSRRRPLATAASLCLLVVIAGGALFFSAEARRSSLVRRAETLSEKSDYSSAVRLLAPYVKANRADYEVSRLLAKSLLYDGDPQAAFDLYTDSYRANKHSHDLAMAAFCQASLRNHAVAAGIYEMVLDSGVEDPQVYKNLVSSYFVLQADGYDRETSMRIGSLLMAARQIDPDDEATSLLMLRHYLGEHDGGRRALPDYPLGIARLHSGNGCLEFCKLGARFISIRAASDEELLAYGWPCLKRLAEYVGQTRAESYLTGREADRYRQLSLYEQQPDSPARIAPPYPRIRQAPVF